MSGCPQVANLKKVKITVMFNQEGSCNYLMKTSRREFLAAGGAFALLLNGGCAFRAANGRFGGDAAEIRFGVLSDIHLRERGDEKRLLTSLEFFRSRNVDGVVIAGDIADRGRRFQLEMLAAAWESVFPGGRGADGRPVERLFIYGNHCVEAWTWGEPYKGRDDLAAKEAIGYGDNRARMWEEVFHEKYEPIWMKNVKGFTFIGAHWKDGGVHTDIDRFLAEHADELDPTRPFFYIQHAHPKGTCYGEWAWGHDDGVSTRALSAFPNAVAFSGHSHYTLTDDRTVWQGAFTSINTASLKYASQDYSLRDNVCHASNEFGYTGERERAKPMNNVDTMRMGQGMLVSVYGDRMVIERREFVSGENLALGDDWVMPLPVKGSERPYAYEAQAKRKVAPEFASGAKVAVSFVESERQGVGRVARLEFPRAVETDRASRVFEYEVSAVLVEDDVDLVQVQRRFLAPDFAEPLARAEATCRFDVPVSELKLKGRYRFEARPLESFGKKGAPISSGVVTVGE